MPALHHLDYWPAAGSGAEAYLIQGIGLSAWLLQAGIIHGARDAFPFLLIQLPASCSALSSRSSD